MVSKKSNNAINIISWISVAAIAVTTGALVIILSAMNGLTGTVATLYNALEPDIKLSAARGKNFKAGDSLMQIIKSVDGVKRVSGTITDKALIQNMDRQLQVTVKGVDVNFNQLTNINSFVYDGKYDLDQKEKSILLGDGVATRLGVNIHDLAGEVTLFSPVKGKVSSFNPEDALNKEYVRPTGVFSLTPEIDYEFVFVRLKTAQDLFDESGKVSAVEISCEQGKEKKAEEQLRALLGKDFVIKNRYQLNDILFKTLETEKLAVFIIVAFILIIATFNIIGALTMLIIEKSKDIKTLYSMGANLKMIRSIFMREGFLITIIGTLIGILLGVLICWVQIQFHVITFEDGVIPYYPVEMQTGDFLKIFGVIMIIGFFAALYPVRIFTKMDLVHKSD